MAEHLAELFQRDLTRLIQELRAFPSDDLLWKTAPGVTNSAGNLTLHIEGNLREYLGRLLGGIPYTRERASEFSVTGLTCAELIARIEGTIVIVTDVVSKLAPEALAAPYPDVAGAMQPTERFVLSLYSHVSYHLGQIGYLRRILTNGRPRESYE